MDTTPSWILIIIAAIGAIPGLAALWANRRNNAANVRMTYTSSDSQVVKDAIELVQTYRQEVTLVREEQKRLSEVVRCLQGDLAKSVRGIRMRDMFISYLIDGIRRLVCQVESLKVDNVAFTPMTLDEFEKTCGDL
jgi:predicted methyltransferase MtxX (methanogen marker protein 4)